jgi:hypothetical protein
MFTRPGVFTNEGMSHFPANSPYNFRTMPLKKSSQNKDNKKKVRYGKKVKQ